MRLGKSSGQGFHIGSSVLIRAAIRGAWFSEIDGSIPYQELLKACSTPEDHLSIKWKIWPSFLQVSDMINLSDFQGKSENFWAA